MERVRDTTPGRMRSLRVETFSRTRGKFSPNAKLGDPSWGLGGLGSSFLDHALGPNWDLGLGTRHTLRSAFGNKTTDRGPRRSILGTVSLHHAIIHPYFPFFFFRIDLLHDLCGRVSAS